MPNILKKNTAILQVPEKVINDKNKLVNSITNKGDLKKDTIKIQIGKTLKIVSKGTSIEQKEPEIYKTYYGNKKIPIIIKPLTQKELKKIHGAIYRKIDSIEKFNSLNFNDKWSIENEFNSDILDEISREYVEQNYNGPNYMESNYDDDKFDKAVDKYTDKFYKILTKLRKKSKIEFLEWLDNEYDNIKNYRFIF